MATYVTCFDSSVLAHQPARDLSIPIYASHYIYPILHLLALFCTRTWDHVEHHRHRHPAPATEATERGGQLGRVGCESREQRLRVRQLRQCKGRRCSCEPQNVFSTKAVVDVYAPPGTRTVHTIATMLRTMLTPPSDTAPAFSRAEHTVINIGNSDMPRLVCTRWSPSHKRIQYCVLTTVVCRLPVSRRRRVSTGIRVSFTPPPFFLPVPICHLSVSVSVCMRPSQADRLWFRCRRPV